jgi:hypothetical protein
VAAAVAASSSSFVSLSVCVVCVWEEDFELGGLSGQCLERSTSGFTSSSFSEYEHTNLSRLKNQIQLQFDF